MESRWLGTAPFEALDDYLLDVHFVTCAIKMSPYDRSKAAMKASICKMYVRCRMYENWEL